MKEKTGTEENICRYLSQDGRKQKNRKKENSRSKQKKKPSPICRKKMKPQSKQL